MKYKIYDFLDKCSCDYNEIIISLDGGVFHIVDTVDDFITTTEGNVVEIIGSNTYHSIDCSLVDEVVCYDNDNGCSLAILYKDCIMEICGV